MGGRLRRRGLREPGGERRPGPPDRDVRGPARRHGGDPRAGLGAGRELAGDHVRGDRTRTGSARHRHRRRPRLQRVQPGGAARGRCAGGRRHPPAPRGDRSHRLGGSLGRPLGAGRHRRRLRPPARPVRGARGPGPLRGGCGDAPDPAPAAAATSMVGHDPGRAVRGGDRARGDGPAGAGHVARRGGGRGDPGRRGRRQRRHGTLGGDGRRRPPHSHHRDRRTGAGRGHQPPERGRRRVPGGTGPGSRRSQRDDEQQHA